MACSAVSLSIATIISVVCAAALAIAFSTDNWNEIRVDRNKIAEIALVDSGIKDAMSQDTRFYSRDEGLFRVCFVDEKPRNVETYISPTQTDCFNINYHIPEDGESEKFSSQRWERLQMGRCVILSLIVSLVFLFLSFFTGVAGCWKRSHANLIATGTLQLLASLFAACSMALWHAVQFYEQHKLKDDLSYAQWPEILREPGICSFYFGWSYILAWSGVVLSLISSTIFLSSAKCIRREKRAEHAKNMQYLMPVYSDKRNPYSSSYAYAYPPPYSPYHGTQYGPYAFWFYSLHAASCKSHRTHHTNIAPSHCVKPFFQYLLSPHSASTWPAFTFRIAPLLPTHKLTDHLTILSQLLSHNYSLNRPRSLVNGDIESFLFCLLQLVWSSSFFSPLSLSLSFLLFFSLSLLFTRHSAHKKLRTASTNCSIPTFCSPSKVNTCVNIS